MKLQTTDAQGIAAHKRTSVHECKPQTCSLIDDKRGTLKSVLIPLLQHCSSYIRIYMPAHSEMTVFDIQSSGIISETITSPTRNPLPDDKQTEMELLEDKWKSIVYSP